MKRHEYQYDEIVVGGSLPAIVYSYINQKPLIFKPSRNLFFYEYYEPDYPLNKLFLANHTKELNMPIGKKKVGIQKIEVYNRLLFVLSLGGYIPLSDKIEKIRIEKENILKISTARARVVRVKFNKLRVFDPELITGLDSAPKGTKKCLVHDFLKLKMQDHHCDLLNVGDNFIKDVYFYGIKKKDVLVTSTLTEEELTEFDYSSVPLKYKLKDILLKNGFQKSNYESKIIVEHLKRNVYNNKKKSFKSTKNIILDEREEKEICQDIILKTPLPLLGVYPWRLNHLLLDSNGMTH